MTRTLVLTLTALIFVTASIATPCSLEMSGDVTSYVSFGDSNCVLQGANPQTIEIWLYPIKEGASYGDGVVFNSGWFNVTGKQLAYVLSVKQHDQLLGYVLSRQTPSSRLSEIITASQTGVLKANKWTHVMWHPEAQRFYIDGAVSAQGTVSANVLAGMSDFVPGDVLKVGQSFSGRLTALRLWSSLVTYDQVLTHFNNMKTSCDQGVGANVIGFWDFTVCSGKHVPAFKGNACGRIHPKKSAKWVSQTLSGEIPFVSIANDTGHTWVDVCSAESTCPITCRTKHHHSHHRHHRHHRHHDRHKMESPDHTTKKSPEHKSSSEKSRLPASLKNTNFIVSIAAGVVLALVVGIVSCFCNYKEIEANEEKAQDVEETEQLQNSGSDDEVLMHSMEPVYIPIRTEAAE